MEDVMVISAYISGASSEHKRAATLAGLLHGSDVVMTPDAWWEDASFSGRDHEHTPEERIRITRRHFAMIGACDVLWFLAPSPGHYSKMAWAELGWAQAQDRALAIVVSGSRYADSVCTSLTDRQFLTDEEALAHIIDLARRS